jgi:hypothetical protein
MDSRTDGTLEYENEAICLVNEKKIAEGETRIFLRLMHLHA